MSEKPSNFPTAWPSDGRSKMRNEIGIGWVLTHPERGTVVWKDEAWQMFQGEKAA